MPVTVKVLASCYKYALATIAGLSEFTILFRVTRLGGVESEREEQMIGSRRREVRMIVESHVSQAGLKIGCVAHTHLCMSPWVNLSHAL